MLAAMTSDALIHALRTAGLDIAHLFDAHTLAALAGDTPIARWRCLADAPRLALLVGNTRALWPLFTAARSTLPVTDPLDAYVERAIASAITQVTDEPARVWFTHRTYDGAFLPFQQLAVATGLAALGDGGLAIHPTYGPWFALRAVIELPAALAASTPAVVAPIAKPCACTGACEAALAVARANLDDWRAWLAVRDACSLRAYRYSDEQIRFHYASAWPAAGDSR